MRIDHLLFNSLLLRNHRKPERPPRAVNSLSPERKNASSPVRPPRADSGRPSTLAPRPPPPPPPPTAVVGAGRRAKPARCRRRRPCPYPRAWWGGAGFPSSGGGALWWSRFRRWRTSGGTTPGGLMEAVRPLGDGAERRPAMAPPGPHLGPLGPIWDWAGQVWCVCSRRPMELLRLRTVRTVARGLQRGHGSFASPTGLVGQEGPRLLL
jgi:hypothetical protein